MTDRLPCDDYREKCNPKWGARIVNCELLLAYGQHVDPEFLAKLATDCVFVGFSGFAFAAGKLPQTAIPLVRGSLANQELIISSGDSRDDAN